tara:strand:- start:211 stop:450 length:240 start_codon:yes stop_codon:yes gene_type:complete
MIDFDAIDKDPWTTWPVAKDELRMLVKKNKKLRAVLRECQAMLNIAFDYDGDVFGRSHNRAVDAEFAVRAVLKGEKTND